MVVQLLFGFAVLSVLLTLWQWAAGRRFPLHERLPGRGGPAFSILKPLKGAGPHTREALASWFRQKHEAGFEILLGVASPEDPAWGMAEKLLKEFPETSAQIVHCQPLLGPNAKVSSLCHLLERASFEHIIISDDDVLAPPEYLGQLSAAMEAGPTDLVSAIYILAPEGSFGSRWEAVSANADCWTQVLQCLSMRRMDFALGAVMATTRTQMERIGGLRPLSDYLADDYQLGRRMAAAGGRLELCQVPVQCLGSEATFGGAWRHQLRWARTILVCQPVSYFLSVLSNATFWPLLLAAAAPTAGVLGFTAGAVAVRIFTGWQSYARATRARPLFPLVFIPIKDLLQVLFWAGAFLGNKVTWRGEVFRVSRNGMLSPVQ